MKSISLLASLAAVSAICVSISCSSKSDSGGAGGTTASGGTSSGGTSAEAGAKENGGSGAKPSGGSTGTEGGDTGMGPGGDTGTSPGGDTGVGVGTCGQGVLLEGDPKWNDVLTGNVPAGQALLADPPIRNEAIAVIGTKLFVETEFELWSADMSAANPKIARIAGNETATNQFVNAGVACKDTTFLVMRDMIAEPNGKLAIVDFVGGAVIEITDPGGATCKSDWVAGTHVKTADPAQAYPLAQGDMDGPGAGALFGGDGSVVKGAGIHKITVDPDGNLYVYDDGTGKYKKIGTDAARTVTTIGQGSIDDVVMGIAFLKGKLYATGVDGSNDFLIEVDPAKYKAATPKGNVVDVFRSPGDQFPEIAGTGHQAIPSQVYSDGEALIVASQSQYIWRMAADGTILATLAGSGTFIDFTADFDPTKPHAAKDWQLVYKLSNPDGGPWLALNGTDLYWSGGGGTGKNILKFSCP